MSWWTIF